MGKLFGRCFLVGLLCLLEVLSALLVWQLRIAGRQWAGVVGICRDRRLLTQILQRFESTFGSSLGVTALFGFVVDCLLFGLVRLINSC
jgi:hypothetical protein